MTNWARIRSDFPVLSRVIENKQLIYLDSACTTLRPQKVVDAISYYYNNLGACGGRSAHQLGFETTELCDNARIQIAQFIRAKKSDEIVWTRNTTEAINLLANSITFNRNDEILTTTLEHHSGILPFYEVAKKKHLNLKLINPDSRGIFSIENWKEAITPKTKVISLIHTSNFTGTSNPLKQIIDLAHDHGILVIADSAQNIPHHPINVSELDIDFLAFSIHKMCGPSGMGVLYGRYDHLENLEPYMVGGNTISDVTYDPQTNMIKPTYLPPPAKFEAGLQNYAGIIGAGAAAEYLTQIGMNNIESHIHQLLIHMLEGLQKIPEIQIIGPTSSTDRSGLVAFRIQGIECAQDIGQFLDCDIPQFRVMIRAGTHCVNPFHYSLKILPDQGTARASLYLYNTIEDINIFLDALGLLISKMT